MNNSKCCGTCAWYAEFEGVCCCADSKWAADFRDSDYACECWRENKDVTGDKRRESSN